MKVFIDIETIPAQSDVAMDLLKSNIEQAKEKLSPPSNYKAETAEKWMIKKREELDSGFEQAHLKTSFNGDLGEIITIGMIIDGNRYVVNRTKDYPEADLLRGFVFKVETAIKNKGETFKKIQWVGHNVIKFDLPFLFKRCVINGINPSFAIPNNARHGFDAYDTMSGWAGFGGHISQDNLCKILGLSTKDGMDGSKVYQVWLDEKYDDIAKYCLSDVNTVVALYERLNFLGGDL